MRIRTIKPEFWQSGPIASLPVIARLVFIGLWCYVDDNGVGIDDADLITAALFPREPRRRRDVVASLNLLAQHGRIVRYDVEGRSYLEVVNWAEHQRVNRPSRTRYPRCPNGQTALLPPDLGVLSESSVSPHAKSPTGTGEQGNRGTGEQGKLLGTTKPRRAPETPIPDDWTPNKAHESQARQLGIDAVVEAERFKNWAEAKDVRYRNWDAAFRNWLVKAAEFKRERAGSAEPTRVITRKQRLEPWMLR